MASVEQPTLSFKTTLQKPVGDVTDYIRLNLLCRHFTIHVFALSPFILPVAIVIHFQTPFLPISIKTLLIFL